MPMALAPPSFSTDLRMRFVSWLLSFAFLLFSSIPAAHAQALQVGGHYSALALEYPDQTRSGVGAFFVYSPRDWVGLDVATTIFTSEDLGGAAWQVLAGPRLGGSVGGLGLYGRLRPGFIHFSDRFYAPDVICIAIFPPPESCLAGATNVALDLGGTVQVSPTPRTVLRFDLGDTLIRYARGGDGAAWRHGVQFTAAFGVAF